MTKKYWKVILVIAVIVLGFKGLEVMLSSFAGGGFMRKSQMEQLSKDSTEAKLLSDSLVKEEIIDQNGRVLDKIDTLTGPDDLVLPVELEPKRNQIFELLNKYRYRLPFPKLIYFALKIVLWVVSMLIGVGYLKMNLMMARDQEPSIEEIYINVQALIPYLLGGLCYGLAVIGGMILLIVPGIILAIMLQMYCYLIIDKEMGPIQSLKRSRVITKGSRGKLFVFGSLLTLLNLGGLLCLVVGLFFTISISSIAMAYVYDRLENAPEVVG